MHWLLIAVPRLSLVAVSRGSALAVLHGAQALGAQASNRCGSRTQEHGLQELRCASGVARGCCSATYGIFLDQGICIPRIGRQIPIHCTIREVPGVS